MTVGDEAVDSAAFRERLSISLASERLSRQICGGRGIRIFSVGVGVVK